MSHFVLSRLCLFADDWYSVMLIERRPSGKGSSFGLQYAHFVKCVCIVSIPNISFKGCTLFLNP